MRMRAFAKRNAKEILRDPLNVIFMLGFPLVVLLLLTALQVNIPEAVFPLETLAPGIAMFGLSFISLFSGMLIAKDRETALLVRLCASPLTAADFILGYILPLVPIAFAQSCICMAAAVALGLPWSVNVLWVPVALLPAAGLFIGIGMLAGIVLNDKQVGGICGALLTNLCAWLSGAWFDLKLVGGVFEKVAYALPFAHAVDMGKAVLAGNYAAVWPHLWWVLGYAVLFLGGAVLLFGKRMKNATL